MVSKIINIIIIFFIIIAIFLIGIIIFVKMNSVSKEEEKYTFYYDTVTVVNYTGLGRNKPLIRLKNNNNTYYTMPSKVIVNEGDIVETIKKDFGNNIIFFDSHLKGTNIGIIKQ